MLKILAMLTCITDENMQDVRFCHLCFGGFRSSRMWLCAGELMVTNISLGMHCLHLQGWQDTLKHQNVDNHLPRDAESRCRRSESKCKNVELDQSITNPYRLVQNQRYFKNFTRFLKCLYFFYFKLYTLHFCSVFTINQQTHSSESLLFHSTAPTCFDVYTSSSGSFLLWLLSYVKNTCRFMVYAKVVYIQWLCGSHNNNTAPQMYILPSERSTY
jgi:hypothetical protein